LRHNNTQPARPASRQATAAIVTAHHVVTVAANELTEVERNLSWTADDVDLDFATDADTEAEKDEE
jgi:hypothetical protein